VDNVREVIIETVGLAPNRDRYKVFIIDETHMLSMAAFNALLKTLEEPPPHVVFVLATTESAKVPATIASRCQRFKFRPVAAETLAQHLAALAKKEKLSAEPEALELLARSAEGSLRDAVSLLDQCRSAGGEAITEELVRDMFGFVPQDLLRGVLAALLAKDARGLAGLVQKAHAEGIEPAQLLRDLRAAAEALYLERLGLEPAGDKALRGLADQATAEQLAFLVRRLNKTLEDLRFGDSPRLILELGLFGCLEAAGDLEAWVRRLEDLERRLASGAAAPSAAPLRSAPQGAERVSGRQEGERPQAESHSAAGKPAAVPAAASPAEAWARAVALIAAEKPALAATLEAARFVAGEGAWRVVFARPFDCDSAKRSQPLIEAKLATAWTKPVKLSLEVGQSGHTGSQELVQKSVEAAPAGEAGEWSDASEGAPAAPKGALTKAQQILGGKMRIVKKPAP
jgi:DNA polymerase-3 subunit gamma/tau